MTYDAEKAALVEENQRLRQAVAHHARWERVYERALSYILESTGAKVVRVPRDGLDKIENMALRCVLSETGDIVAWTDVRPQPAAVPEGEIN